MTPVGTTAYGTPRTFSATIVNLGTGDNTFGGSITFTDANHDTLCTTTVQPNNTLIGTTVSHLRAPSAAPTSGLADARLWAVAGLATILASPLS